jgi:hypothetical protein
MPIGALAPSEGFRGPPAVGLACDEASDRPLPEQFVVRHDPMTFAVLLHPAFT